MLDSSLFFCNVTHVGAIKLQAVRSVRPMWASSVQWRHSNTRTLFLLEARQVNVPGPCRQADERKQSFNFLERFVFIEHTLHSRAEHLVCTINRPFATYSLARLRQQQAPNFFTHNCDVHSNLNALFNVLVITISNKLDIMIPSHQPSIYFTNTSHTQYSNRFRDCHNSKKYWA